MKLGTSLPGMNLLAFQKAAKWTRIQMSPGGLLGEAEVAGGHSSQLTDILGSPALLLFSYQAFLSPSLGASTFCLAPRGTISNNQGWGGVGRTPARDTELVEQGDLARRVCSPVCVCVWGGAEGCAGGGGNVSSEAGGGGQAAAPQLRLSRSPLPARVHRRWGRLQGFPTAPLLSSAAKDFQMLEWRRRLRTATPPPNGRLPLSPSPARAPPPLGRRWGCGQGPV